LSTALPADVLPALLELLPSGVVYYLPVTDATGSVVDFTFAYLNPAAQQQLHLPAQPTVTFAQYFTPTDPEGLAFLLAAYQQPGPLRRTGYYRASGQDTPYTVNAQRVKEALLVHFTLDVAADQQAPQLQAQVTPATRQTQRDELTRLFEQAPLAIAILTGPELRIDLANAAVGAIWGRAPADVLGRPYFEALPETAGQGFEQILTGVLTTGQSFFVTEAPVRLPRLEAGVPVQAFVNFGFHPLRDAQQQVVSVLALGVEVSEQVRARQQVEQLNQELEAQVQARTQEAEAARAEAERQRGELERIFEQAPAAIAVYRGPTYTIELANSTVARLWGRTQEQLIGKGLFEALPEVAGMGYEELLDGVMATGTPHVAHAMEAQHDRNGQRETVYWDFVYVPVHAADGTINGAMVVATEVTAQVRARQQVEQLNQELETRVRERTRQLSEQQRLLGQILNQVPAAVATLSGPQHHFTFFNEQYQTIVAGRARLGSPLMGVVPEVAAQGFIAILDAVYTTGQPFLQAAVPAQLYDPTTEALVPHYVDLSYQPLLDGQGSITGILAFVLNVTEQVLAQQQADTLQAAMLAVAQRQAHQREELYQIFEQATVAVAVLREPQHRIEYFNPAYAHLFPGWAQRGITLAETQPSTVAQGLLSLLDHVYATGETHYGHEQRVLVTATPRQPHYVNFTYQAYREDDVIVGIAVFAFDVTEQVQARQLVQSLNEELAAINEELRATNEELHASNTQLLRTNTDLDTFVYTASHDLKAPIANIEGLLEALSRNLPTAVTQEPLIARLLALMSGAVDRFRQTIAHLTNIVQLQQIEASAAVRLSTLVTDVQLDLAPLLEATTATLTLAVDECEPVYVPANTLRSVLYNLLSNALKYRAPDRAAWVALRVQCSPNHVVVQVQDNGLGLSEEQQARLFGLFRRLHTHVEGAGVGLYTVKRLVENAGGTIAVQSQLDVGSTFTVSLPL